MSLKKYYLKALFFHHQTFSQFHYGLVIQLNDCVGQDNEIWAWGDHHYVDDSADSPHEDRPCCEVCAAVVDSEDLLYGLLGMVDEDLSDTFHLSCLPDMEDIHAELLGAEECGGRPDQEHRKLCCR